MTVFVLVVVMFLTGGQVVSQAMAVSPGATVEDCKALGVDVVAKLQDQQLSDEGGEKLTVLDAQAVCVAVTKLDHA